MSEQRKCIHCDEDAVLSMRTVLPEHLATPSLANTSAGERIVGLVWFPACTRCRKRLWDIAAEVGGEFDGLLFEEMPLDPRLNRSPPGRPRGLPPCRPHRGG
ncbi:hypothetical protein ACWDYH_31385 [Nocardia goodfellowii]